MMSENEPTPGIPPEWPDWLKNEVIEDTITRTEIATRTQELLSNPEFKNRVNAILNFNFLTTGKVFKKLALAENVIALFDKAGGKFKSRYKNERSFAFPSDYDGQKQWLTQIRILLAADNADFLQKDANMAELRILNNAVCEKLSQLAKLLK